MSTHVLFIRLKFETESTEVRELLQATEIYPSIDDSNLYMFPLNS